MLIPNINDIDSGINALVQLRKYKPFKYSGRKYCALFGTDFYFYASLRSLKARAVKYNIFAFEMVIIDK